ncbi:MAG: DNA repair protein RadC [Clostridium sp.]
MESLTMKEMPRADRPYEKCLSTGPGSLTDAELLAVILRTGSRGGPSLAVAAKVLNLNYPGGILGLLHLSLPELMTIKGIGKVKGIELLCVGELSKRIWKTLTIEEAPTFNDPEVISAFYMEDMRHKEQEELHLMMLNTKNILIRESLIFRGTVNASMASPREMFIEAFRYHAVRIILVHNHPSGDPTPSREDGIFTNRVKEAGALLGIPLIDHIVIGDHSYFSFRERGII